MHLSSFLEDANRSNHELKNLDQCKILIGSPNLWFHLAGYMYTDLSLQITFHTNRRVKFPDEVKQLVSKKASLRLKWRKVVDMFKDQLQLPRIDQKSVRICNQNIQYIDEAFEKDKARSYSKACKFMTIAKFNVKHLMIFMHSHLNLLQFIEETGLRQLCS